MQKPQIKVVFTNERLITPSGLTIVGGMLGKSDFVQQCNRIPVDKKRSEPQIKDGDILLTYIGLLCQGKTEFEAVREMQDDPEYYKYALGIARSIPSAETLRQRMDDIRSASCRRQESAWMISIFIGTIRIRALAPDSCNTASTLPATARI